jgi:hypothetical protein
LQTNQWDRLQEAADRFEELWRSDGAADVQRFLPYPEDPLRPVILEELIKADLEFRWRRGQGMELECYLEQFPELATARGPSPQLIYEEYRVRQCYGDRADLVVYRERFPNQFQQLQGLIEERPLPPVGVCGQTPLPEATGTHEWRMTGSGYKLIRPLGKGSFGRVWLAEAPGGVEVAVKVLARPLGHEDTRRELQVVELMKRLHHPFLLPTLACWPQEDRLYLVMELADGSLRDRFQECRNAGLPGIPRPELLGYVREAAEALDYLHAQRVSHRDINPQNILLQQRHAKVADFGLASLQEPGTMTATGAGTPVYMPPEGWCGCVSPHSDQYSLAITYTELRLGRPPFLSRDLPTLMLDHLERPPALSALPEGEQQVLDKALAKDPDQRFPSCLEFAEALEYRATRAGEATLAPSTPAPRPRPSGRGAAPWHEDPARDHPAAAATLARAIKVLSAALDEPGQCSEISQELMAALARVLEQRRPICRGHKAFADLRGGREDRADVTRFSTLRLSEVQ